MSFLIILASAGYLQNVLYRIKDSILTLDNLNTSNNFRNNEVQVEPIAPISESLIPHTSDTFYTPDNQISLQQSICVSHLSLDFSAVLLYISFFLKVLGFILFFIFFIQF